MNSGASPTVRYAVAILFAANNGTRITEQLRMMLATAISEDEAVGIALRAFREEKGFNAVQKGAGATIELCIPIEDRRNEDRTEQGEATQHTGET